MPYCFGFFQFRLGHDGVTSSVKSSPLARLLQVGPHYVEEFFSCFQLRSILARLRVEDVESDMTLQHFRHRAVQGTTTGGHGRKYAGTFVPSSARSTASTCPRILWTRMFRFVCAIGSVPCHIIYPSRVYCGWQVKGL